MDPSLHFIDGGLVASRGTERLENRSPATEALLGEIHLALAPETDAALSSAQAGMRTWSAMSGAARARVLLKAAALITERTPALARLEVLDTGKPIREALDYDVPSTVEVLEFFAGVAGQLAGVHLDLGAGEGHAHFFTRREPVGVCVGIGAWNYPFQIAVWKSAPALACGNAMVFKPSELTPLSALELAKIYLEAGVPPGVFNVVQGDARTGELLTGDPRVAKVSLTGEVGTGRRVMAAAAKTLKNVTLELGGKSPLIIFDDAPMEAAVNGAMAANFYSQGEVCSNGTRVFVHRSLHEEFVTKLEAAMQDIVLGDPLDPTTTMGALISKGHRDKVLGYIQRGEASGARKIEGGNEPPASGYFVRPVAFDGCDDESPLVREEIFGPVCCILPFDDEDEVIRRANDTEYGLAAGVFTRDLSRAYRVVASLEAGVCWINTFNVTPPAMPYGGVKQSGIGRENGTAAVEHYTRTKSVYVELGELEQPFPKL